MSNMKQIESLTEAKAILNSLTLQTWAQNALAYEMLSHAFSYIIQQQDEAIKAMREEMQCTA